MPNPNTLILFIVLILFNCSLTSKNNLKLNTQEFSSKKFTEKKVIIENSEFEKNIYSFVYSTLKSPAFFITTIASFTFNKWAVNLSSFFAIGIVSLSNYCLSVKLINEILSDLLLSILFLFIGSQLLSDALGFNIDEIEELKINNSIPNGKIENNCRSKCETEQYACHIVEYNAIIKDFNELEQINLEKSAWDYMDQQDAILLNNDQLNPSFVEDKTLKKIFYEFLIIFLIVFIGEEGSNPQMSHVFNKSLSFNLVLIVELSISSLISTIISVIVSILISYLVSTKNLKLFSGIVFVLYSIICFMTNDIRYNKHIR